MRSRRRPHTYELPRRDPMADYDAELPPGYAESLQGRFESRPVYYPPDSPGYGDPKPEPRTRPSPPAGPLLAQLAGMPEARQWGEALAQDMQDFIAGRLAWSEVDPGCVVHGPPGTGKTTFAKALAATCKLPLIASSYGQWQGAGEGHLGTLVAAMTRAFEDARAAAPCIFFIDELDSIPARAGNGQNAQYWNAAINHLLKLLDGILENAGVVTIAACNHPEMLDPALVRAGRLDRKIAIPLPGLAELPGILRYHLKDDAPAIGDLRSMAALCIGMSGADIEQLVREARRAARRNKRALSREDLVAVIDPADRHPPHTLRRRIAVHEAGHAVAAMYYGLSHDITVSIVRREGMAGRMMMQLQEGAVTRRHVGKILTVLLAGRAAEEVMLGDVSGGAGGSEQSDLAVATRIACDAVGRLGLSSQESLIWHQALPHALSGEAAAMLDDAYTRALQLIASQERLVGDIAESLISRRVLTHAELVLLRGGPSSPLAVNWENSKKQIDRLCANKKRRAAFAAGRDAEK